MAWTAPDLSPAGNPVLDFGEGLVLTAEGVSLYDGETRSEAHAEGTAFLTTRRVVYVDAADPLRHSVAAALPLVRACEYTARFLAASAKIRLRLAAPDAAAEQRTWICPICSFRNERDAPAGELPVCRACGMRAPPEALEAPRPAEARVAAPGECAQCTFQNHASLVFCEMCGARLRAEHARVGLGTDVRLSFRRGGSHAFFAALEAQLRAAPPTRAAAAAPTDAAFGIEKLELQSRVSRDRTDELLRAAFASPTALRQHSRELLAVAAQLGPAPGPVVAGVPPQPAAALARQIADFLVGLDVLEQSGEMMLLPELYARYNRARGVRLISPAEMLAALELCEPLDLPIRVRTIGALRIVVARGSRDRLRLRLLRWMGDASQQSWRGAAGFSARDVAEHFGCSVQGAFEELRAAEADGALCRDEHTSGLRFFCNRFLPESASAGAGTGAERRERSHEAA